MGVMSNQMQGHANEQSMWYGWCTGEEPVETGMLGLRALEAADLLQAHLHTCLFSPQVFRRTVSPHCWMLHCSVAYAALYAIL